MAHREFGEILVDLDDGQVHERLTQKLRDVVQGARDAQLAGKLTLTLTITPEGRQFIITPKITTNIPTPKTGVSMFFADNDGTLTKSDPKQIELRNVTSKPPTKLREVAPIAAPQPSQPQPEGE